MSSAEHIPSLSRLISGHLPAVLVREREGGGSPARWKSREQKRCGLGRTWPSPSLSLSQSTAWSTHVPEEREGQQGSSWLAGLWVAVPSPAEGGLLPWLAAWSPTSAGHRLRLLARC